MKRRLSKHYEAKNPSFLARGITGTQLNGGYISGYESNPSFTFPAHIVTPSPVSKFFNDNDNSQTAKLWNSLNDDCFPPVYDP